MNDADFIARLDEAALGVDSNRWLVAELAADCSKDKYPAWAERIGKHPLIARDKHTVREWARTADFRRRLPKRPRVSFSHYVAAMNKLDQLEAPVLLELLETAEAHGHILEEFRAQLSSMVGPAVSGSKAERLRCLAAGWKRAAWKYKRLYYQERARNVILRATNVMPVVSSPMIIIGDDE